MTVVRTPNSAAHLVGMVIIVVGIFHSTSNTSPSSSLPSLVTAFTASSSSRRQQQSRRQSLRRTTPFLSHSKLMKAKQTDDLENIETSRKSTKTTATLQWWTSVASAVGIASLAWALSFGAPSAAWAENELSAKYGGGLDTSLVDQTCLVDHCSLQAKACLQDDPSCRKGLTCTAKCLGDNACITGCMARYGNERLDQLLTCTIEEHECIKVAILPGGADAYAQAPRAPAPTIPNFNVASLEGSWYKVVGYNPNYDCYACQRNTFAIPNDQGSNGNSNGVLPVANWLKPLQPNRLEMDVEFSMPHLLPDGSPPPPSGLQESVWFDKKGGSLSSSGGGLQSMALNDYRTHETMIFDAVATDGSNNNPLQRLVLNQGTNQEASYARTAHSEGEMFGLKFWENWYIIGENDKDEQEFKFVYYNGKTRQNTYEGAFVYSRTKDLSPQSLKKVYRIAQEAGMDPNQFCRIRNGCFADKTEPPDYTGLGSPSNPFRGILASTRVSELLGVEPVAARDTIRRDIPTAQVLSPQSSSAASSTTAAATSRKWWFEVGDYLENPHRHFQAMDKLRLTMDWPEDVSVSTSANK